MFEYNFNKAIYYACVQLIIATKINYYYYYKKMEALTFLQSPHNNLCGGHTVAEAIDRLNPDRVLTEGQQVVQFMLDGPNVLLANIRDMLESK